MSRQRRRSPVLKAGAVRMTEGGGSPPKTQTQTADRVLRVMEAAKRAAGATMAQAQRDAASIRKQAYVQGAQEGRAQALSEAAAEAQRMLGQAQQTAKQIVGDAEQTIIELSTEIAAHLIGMELTLNPEAIERVVLSTLKEVGSAGPVEIGVSPDDYEQAIRAQSVFREALGTGGEVHVVTDPSLPRGGCRISGPHGVVERDWRQGLAAVAQALEEVGQRGV